MSAVRGRLFTWMGSDGKPRRERHYTPEEKQELVDELDAQAREAMERNGNVDMNEVARQREAIYNLPTDFGS